MGIFWGLCSVIITSVAQLSLGYAMDNLPPMLQPLAFISAVFATSSSAFALYGGLVGYLLSVMCWHKALHQLALSKAYALLSLSYVLVWIASMILPGWQRNLFSKSPGGCAVYYGGINDHILTCPPTHALRSFIVRQLSQTLPFFGEILSGINDFNHSRCVTVNTILGIF